MIRRPPRSTRTDTLLPYTTLFRSGFGIDGDIDEEAGLLAARLAFLHQFDDAARRGAPRLPGTAHRGAADRLAVHIVAERDVVERIVGLDQDDRKAERLIGSGPDPDGLPVILAQPVLGGGRGRAAHRESGRAHVRTPVTNAHLVCRLLL